MSHEPFDFKKFAADRSSQNSRISSELGRASAQAVMFINGGAVTAILTFAKDVPLKGIEVAIGLSGYGIGVLSGAWMMYCMNRLLDARNEFWQSYFNPDKSGVEHRDKSNSRSTTWLRLKNVAFAVSVVAFVVASTWLGFVIYK